MQPSRGKAIASSLYGGDVYFSRDPLKGVFDEYIYMHMYVVDCFVVGLIECISIL